MAQNACQASADIGRPGQLPFPGYRAASQRKKQCEGSEVVWGNCFGHWSRGHTDVRERGRRAAARPLQRIHSAQATASRSASSRFSSRDRTKAMALRISHLLLAMCLLLVSCFALSDAANSMHVRAATRTAASFNEKLQNLRKLAATEQGATRDLIESLDELDDIELTQLRVPKRALMQDGSAPAYGGRRQMHQAGTYPGVKRRSLLQGVYP